MFVTFEGCEASGKSTQAAILRDYFIRKNYDMFFTKEPGGTRLADLLREMLLSNEVDDVMTEFLLFSAARRDHTLRIKQKLRDGAVVISDRFYDSSVAIQALTKNLDIAFVEHITHHLLDGLRPDITFLLDVSVEELQKRLKNHGRLINFYDKKDMQFHQKVKENFLEIAKLAPQRIVVVNGDSDIHTIAHNIRSKLETRFEL